MNKHNTDKNKLINLLDNLIAYRKIFVDYDRYRSKNQEEINAIAFANELIEPCQINIANKTLHSCRTSFYKDFKNLRYFRNKIVQSNSKEYKRMLLKTVQQLNLSRYYLKKCVFDIDSNCRTKPLPKGFSVKKNVNPTNYLRTIRRISDLVDT